MSPEEIELLQHVGGSFLSNVNVVVAQSVLYGLYLAIFTFGMRALLRRNPWTKYTWILFGSLSFLFILSTTNFAIIVTETIDFMRDCLVNNPDKPLTERIQLAAKGTNVLDTISIYVTGGSGSGLLYISADAVVVWRACVLWPDSKIVRSFPLTLLFVSFACAMVSATMESVLFPNIGTIPPSSSTGIMLALSQSLSLATNVVATVLIGYKAYYHRAMMKHSMVTQHSTAGAILLFMTESGIAFCALQVIALATNVPDDTSLSSLDKLVIIWQQITSSAAAAYRVLVLIIVDRKLSISDYTGGSICDSDIAQGSNAGGLGVGSHLSFAVRPPGISSSGGREVGADNMIGSSVDPTVSADESQDSVRFGDLEKGKVPIGAVVPTGDH